MEHSVNFYGIKISLWIYLPLVYLLWVFSGLLIKRILFASIQRFSKRTKTYFDDILVQALDVPLFLLIFVSGGVFVEHLIPAANSFEVTKYFLPAFKAIAIIAAVIFSHKFIYLTIDAYTPRHELLRTSSGVVKVVARVAVFGIGLLILLDSFGVSITPILASLGVGSLAVALALQPTLENFFSGVQLIVDKPIKVGQLIKLESGQEGYVEKIGWRSTWLKLLNNNMVILPNKTVVNSAVTNYCYPDQEVTVVVDLGVHYRSDLEKVERVTIEVGREIMNTVSGGVPGFEPLVRYQAFGEYSIKLMVILRAKEHTDQSWIQHVFVKKLHACYAKEGIIIPYPIRAANTVQEKAFE